MLLPDFLIQAASLALSLVEHDLVLFDNIKNILIGLASERERSIRLPSAWPSRYYLQYSRL